MMASVYDIIDVDYNYTYDCENYGCGDGGDVCRCCSISSTPDCINGLNYKSYYSILESLNTKISNNLIDFSISCLMKKNDMFNVDNYEVYTSRGYYGDEVDDITIDDSILNKFNNDVLQLFTKNKTVDEIVKALLVIEYGSLLPKYKNLTFNIEQKLFSDFRTKINYNQKVLDSIQENHVTNIPSILGIYHQKDENNYNIIDGYHRLHNMFNSNMNYVNKQYLDVIIGK